MTRGALSESALAALLAEGLVRHHVPGASMAVFHRGEMRVAACGVTNVVTGVALTPDTVMHVGSITKVFTTTLVMQLVDEGAVDLDEGILRYLPDLVLKDRAALERITVKMLLNHTSGIDGTGLPDHGHDEETIEKGIRRLSRCGQISVPGAEFSYCNAGMVIAGYLAQRLGGKSWHRLVRERILQPLDMQQAATLPEEALLHRASVGHCLEAAGEMPTRTPVAFGPLSRAPSGTTLMMSAANLIAFARAHMALGRGPNGARILSAESAKAMQRVTVDNRGKGYTYLDMGLGWMVSDRGLLHHAGGGPGIASVLYVHPAHEFAVAILTNAEYGLGLANELLEPWLPELANTKLLGELDVRMPPRPVEIDHGRYEGVYEETMMRFSVSRTGAGLALSKQARVAYSEHASLDPTPGVPLVPLGNEQFLLDAKGDYRLPEGSRVFAFRNPDASGRMQHLGNVMRLYKRAS